MNDAPVMSREWYYKLFSRVLYKSVKELKEEPFEKVKDDAQNAVY